MRVSLDDLFMGLLLNHCPRTAIPGMGWGMILHRGGNRLGMGDILMGAVRRYDPVSTAPLSPSGKFVAAVGAGGGFNTKGLEGKHCA